VDDAADHIGFSANIRDHRAFRRLQEHILWVGAAGRANAHTCPQPQACPKKGRHAKQRATTIPLQCPPFIATAYRRDRACPVSARPHAARAGKQNPPRHSAEWPTSDGGHPLLV
jgi:hypothetical protein